ncbi:TRAP transporter small permease [Sedimenticola selenatireducens]|uniref:TRAP transporter small permease n=1 Tax=Sedimenticola selenatireducens TaxID=191960 RepID=UPI00048DDF03|nr:TRAP transporter small permease subunit [Sedimenticola selenatireducens]
MRVLFNTIDSIAHWMHRVSGLLLILMMAVVVVDVSTRTIFSLSEGGFDLTFRGGIELVSLGLLYCILLSMPHCVDKGQVVVDLFTQGFSATLQQRIGGIYTLGFAALGLAMSWRFLIAYEDALVTQEVSQDLILPMSRIYLVVIVATLFLGMRSLLVGIRDLLLITNR